MRRFGGMLAGAVVAAAVAASPAVAEDVTLWWQGTYYADSDADLLSFDEELLDDYDTEVADDVVVPAGHEWTIRRLWLRGTYGPVCAYPLVERPWELLAQPCPPDLRLGRVPPGGATFNVAVHADAGGVPGAVLRRTTLEIDDPFPYELVVHGHLREPLPVPAGRWWVAVQADDAPVGTAQAEPRWRWAFFDDSARERSAVFRNPGNGFRTGCTTWRPASSCRTGMSPAIQPSFALHGDRRILDPVPPQTTILSGPPATTTSTDATLIFASSVADARFSCRLDAQPWSDCDSPAWLHDLAPGKHTFSVRATDDYGITDPTPATWSWRVDRPAPTVTAREPAAAATGVPPGAVVRVTFSRLMQRTATQAAFSLKRPDGTSLSGTFRWSAATMTFDPAGDLPRDTELLATVGTGAKDDAGTPLAAPVSWRFRTARRVTAAPSAAAATTGTLRSGTAVALAADDGSLWQVASTTSGTRTTAWHGTFTGVPATASSLAVALRGANSATCSQTVAVLRWRDGAWLTLATGSVGTTEVLVDRPVTATAAEVVSSAGETRVRVLCTAGANFTTRADQLQLTYDRP